MRILVIDDQKRNLASAIETLPGHEVTTAGTIEEAYRILRETTSFDAVCTDLFLPLGNFKGAMGRYATEPKNELPAGLVFAIKASNRGIRTVLCTDADHHQDWICTLLDLIKPDYIDGEVVEDNQKRIAFVEARSVVFNGYWSEKNGKLVRCGWEDRRNKPYVKHWRAAMVWSGLFDQEELLIPENSDDDDDV